MEDNKNRKYILEEYINKKIGRLTILEIIKEKANGRMKIFANTICDCGNNKKVQFHNLVSKTPTLSCGCYNKEVASKLGKSKLHTLENMITKYPGDLKAATELYHGKRSISNKRRKFVSNNLLFELTFDEFYQISRQPCHYCGVPAYQIFPKSREMKSYRSKNRKDNRSPIYIRRYPELFIHNGIDRLDSNLGYTLENSVACCPNCNYAKNDLSIEEFKNWVNRIYNNWIKQTL